MRIGILTHPLKSNYGGILQCYALTVCLKKMGHDPIVIRREYDKSFFLWEWIRAILRFLHLPRYYNPITVDRIVNIRPFVDKYIVRTMPIRSQRQIKKVCRKYDLEAVIVGSDQVWRADFALHFGYNYFLDFVNKDIIKIAYAASLGLSEWQYNKEQTQQLKKLLSDFNAISVRELNAVDMLRDNIGIIVKQTVDPTMLLCEKDYLSVCSERIIDGPYIFVYWLGDIQDLEILVKPYLEEGQRIVSIVLRRDEEQVSVEDWLSYIRHAEFVLTDSFHGVVFSILFQRPVRVCKNDSGGNGRFDTLFRLFNIEKATIVSSDYPQMGKILEEKRKDSLLFLEALQK